MNNETTPIFSTPEQLAAEIETLKKGPGEYEVANEAINTALITEELFRKSNDCESPEIQIALRQAATNNMSEYLLQSANEGFLDLATEKLTKARSIVNRAIDINELKNIIRE